MTRFDLGPCRLAPEAPPVLLLDIGTFFGQDASAAERLIDAVAEAGLPLIKGEILHRADVALDTEQSVSWLGPGGQRRIERYRRLIERKVVSLQAYSRLIEHGHARGLRWVFSVYDLEGARFARDAGAVALKIASSNITHCSLIRDVARLGRPMLLDTGRATLPEIDRAVRWARAAGAERLVVEYSPPGPPTPVDHHNLRSIPAMAARYDAPVGLSDHHATEHMLYAAVALGACVLEKGLCLDGAVDQDVAHALPVSRLAAVARHIADLHQALGAPFGHLSDGMPRHPARMGLIARRPLEPGAKLDRSTVDFAFPSLGIPAEDWDAACGRTVAVSVSARQPLRWSDLTPGERQQ